MLFVACKRCLPPATPFAFVVGEKRPELFVPDRPGRILPSVPSGGGVYIQEIHVHGVQTTSELWHTLVKYAKRNGQIKLSGVTA